MYDLEKPQHFTKEQSKWIKAYVILKIKESKEEVINNIKDSIQEIHKCQFYCMHDLCDKKPHTVDRCIECFYESVMGVLDREKEQNK